MNTPENILGQLGRQIDTGVRKTAEVIRSINPKYPLRAALGMILVGAGVEAYSLFVHSKEADQVPTSPVTRLTPKSLTASIVEITPNIDGQTQHILVFAESSPTEQPIPTPPFTDLLTPTVTGTPAADSVTRYDNDNTNIARAGDPQICESTASAIDFLQANDLFMGTLQKMVDGKKIAEIKVGEIAPWSGTDGSIQMAYREGDHAKWEDVYISSNISTTNVAAKSYSANEELFRKYIVVTEDENGKKNAAEIEVLADCRCGNGVITEAAPSPTITFTESSTATTTPTASATPDNTAVNTPKPPTKPTPTQTPTPTPKAATPTPTKPREASATPQPTPEQPTPSPTPTKPPVIEDTATPQTNPETPSPIPPTSTAVPPVREPSSTPQTNPENPTAVPPTKEPVINPTTVPVPATTVPVAPTAVPTSVGREPTKVPSK